MALLIIGCARNAWADLKKLGPWDGQVMVLNRMGLYYDRPAEHWATLHPKEHRHYPAERARVHNDRPKLHTNIEHPGFEVWPLNPGGSVSLFAAIIGLEMGHEEIVLCGCPLDGTGHFYDPPWRKSPWFERQATADAWKKRLPFFAGRVRSMSGNTKRWLCR